MDPNLDIQKLAAEIELRLDREGDNWQSHLSTEAYYNYVGMLMIAKAIVAAAVHCDQELPRTGVRDN